MKLQSLPPQNIIDGLRGTIDFYVYMSVPCARAWPRPPTGSRSPAVQATWPRWQYAATLVQRLDPATYQLYQDMASGTPHTARDLVTRAYYRGWLIPPRCH